MAGVEEIVHKALRPSAATAAGMFALLAVADLTILPPDAGRLLVVPHGASALLFASYLVLRLDRRLGPESANATVASMAGITIVDAAAGILVAPPLASALGFFILLLGTASVILSTRWMAATTATALGSWAIVWTLAPGPDLIMASAILAVGALLAHLVHAIRLALHRGMMQAHEAMRRSQAELRASEERWRLLVHSAPDVILTTDLEGRIQFVNRPPRPGRPSPIGTSLYDRIPEAERSRVRVAFAETLRTLQPTIYEVTGPAISGGVASYRSTVVPLLQAERVIGLMVIATDITEQRRAEAERAKAAERQAELDHLREVDAFKTSFINAAAHELGTPLTPIRMQLHLLKVKEAHNLTPGAQRGIEILDRNVVRLSSLVKDVLDAARLQAGKMGIKRDEVDVSQVAREAFETFEPTSQAQSVALTASIEPGLGVEGDAARLTQVLFNFLSNALKFTPAGGSVHVDARREGAEVVVRVRDTGAGIPREQLDRLFAPFSRLHEDTPQPKPGTGLGLYISRGIAEQHGGRVWCESEGAGKGATFCIAVPAQVVATAARSG